MDRNEFKEKLNKTSDIVDEKYCEDIIKNSLSAIPSSKNNIGTMNLLIVMEELAELSQEISKYIRDSNNKIGILEEMADVYLGLKYIQKVIGISDEMMNKAINIKLERLHNKNLTNK